MLFYTFKESSETTILIRLSEKCSSNCKYCELPYLKSNDLFNLDHFSNLLLYINKIFSDKFIIGLLGFNLLEYDSLYYILRKNNNLKYLVQISFEDIFTKYNKIINYSNVNINFGIQKILKLEDIKKILLMIKIIEDKKLKLQVNFIVNFTEFKKLLFLLKSKFEAKIYNDRIIFNIGYSIIEFENDLGYSNIEEFGFNNCIAKNNFYLENNNIFIKDDVEIKLNGDIKFHLNNFCNQGIEKISSIYKNNGEILKDFKKLEKLLNSKIVGKTMCKECLNNHIII